MSARNNQETPFLLHHHNSDKLGSKLLQGGLVGAEYLLGLKRCQHGYEQIREIKGVEQFCHGALKQLGVKCRVAPEQLARVPQTGACILIANHPYGGLDGLALINLVSQVRRDFKVMGNLILGRIPQLRKHLISVDPFDRASSARTNIGPLRQALRALKQGELLIMFPAGEVSSWQPERVGVSDPEWTPMLARMVRMSKAAILPVYFPGDNGALFHLAGKIHKSLRTALLPRMLLNKKGLVLKPLIGHPIPAVKLLQDRDDEQLNKLLRLRTYALGLKKKQKKVTAPHESNNAAPLSPEVSAHLIKTEIDSLPPENLLTSGNGMDVYCACADEIPYSLREIARLREFTFRQVGEGTGKALDSDRFDQDYLHLFLWDQKQQRIAGAYRFGQVDTISPRLGADGLYVSTLFRFKPQLLEHLRYGLELGRSFVHPDYQRSFAPLLMLWKGIGHYLVQNPHYRYLFGPVSISADYSRQSRHLMTGTLAANYLIEDLACMVSARLPVKMKVPKIDGFKRKQISPLLQNIDDLSMLIADLEPDSKGIPVLLRHYLNLGGRLLSFNLDPDFSNAVDGLLLVDLQEANKKQLQRYMGKEGYEFYCSRQRQREQCA